ncbi:MAG: GAF domain-containing protein [Deltaproteobacteria bacterium]|nr:GAF domain-containing protein [Deltaproteobacteria bacterium]
MMENQTGFFEVFHEVGRAVLSVLSVREVTHLVAKRMVPALDLKSSSLLLVKEETGGLAVAASHLVSREFLAAEPMEGDRGISRALEGRPHLEEKAWADRPEHQGGLIRAEGIASILSVPMGLRGKIIGVLRLYTAGERSFSEGELELISALTEIGAIAIENARLFEEKGEALSRLLEKGGVEYEYEPPVEKYRIKAVHPGEIPQDKSYAYFSRLHGLARAVASQVDVERILETAAKTIAEAMDVKGCSLLWLNFETHELELVGTHGLSRAYLNKGTLSMDRSIPRVVQGETVFVPDTGRDTRVQYPEAAGREGIVSILSVPIFVKEKVRGVLRLYSSEPRAYPPEDIELVKALAEIGGIAVLNAKLYEARENDYAFWQSTLRYIGVKNSEHDPA